MVKNVNDALAMSVLLAALTTPDQDKVVVVVTKTSGPNGRLLFDPELIESRLLEAKVSDQVEVVVVPHDLTLRLTKTLGEEFRVFNGAARVYPIRVPGRPYVAMLYQDSPRRSLEQSTEALILEVRRCVREHAARERPSPVVLPVTTPIRAVPGPRPKAPSAPGPGLITSPTAEAVRTPARPALTVVDQPALAEDLVAHLLSPARTRPAVMISIPAGQTAPWVNTAKVVEEIGALAEIYLMPTSRDGSWAFAAALSDFPGAECYGGACRVYPTGVDWARNVHRSPLRFAYTAADAVRITDQIISDALAMAFRSGSVGASPQALKPASGEVLGVVAGRALVKLDDGGTASIWPELTAPDVDPEHLLAAGMQVHGMVDVVTNRLDVSEMVCSPESALQNYQVGTRVVARVAAVESDLCVVELLPDFQCTVLSAAVVATTVTVDLRHWLTVGEVVTAVVQARGEAEDDWDLSMIEADPGAPVLSAPSILLGGPSWLDPLSADTFPDLSDADQPSAVESDLDRTEVVAPVMTPAADAEPILTAVRVDHDPPSDALTARLEDITAERDRLVRELAKQEKRRERQEQDATALKTRLRSTQAELAKAKQRTAGLESMILDHEADQWAFADAAEQFRYEVELAWARSVPAAEKGSLSKLAWKVGPDFLQTVDQIVGVDRSKVVGVVVQIITNRVHEFHGRETHQLRTGAGGDDANVTRYDGATCWRVSLQVKTPQARRLHFWRLRDGSIELSAVRLHDDMRP